MRPSTYKLTAENVGGGQFPSVAREQKLDRVIQHLGTINGLVPASHMGVRKTSARILTFDALDVESYCTSTLGGEKM